MRKTHHSSRSQRHWFFIFIFSLLFHTPQEPKPKGTHVLFIWAEVKSLAKLSMKMKLVIGNCSIFKCSWIHLINMMMC